MQQTAEDTDRSNASGHLRAPTPLNTPAQYAVTRPGEPDSRAVTVIRAPSFSAGMLAQGLVRLSRYRELLYTLTVHRLSVRYKQSVLGPLWAILQPVSLMLIYTVIFQYVARIQSEGIPYALFAYSALVPWLSFSTAVSTATNSLVAHYSLVTKVYFPREILPLTYVIAALVDMALASTVLGGLMIYYGVPVTPQAFYVIPIVGVLAAFALGVSLVLSAIQVRYRDIGLATPLLLQIWLFASPVVYPLSSVPERLQGWYVLNPMVGVVENFRRVVVQGSPPHIESLVTAAAISLVLLIAAFAYFTHVQSTVADVL